MWLFDKIVFFPLKKDTKMISSDFEIPSYDSYIVNNTVHQIWTNLSFFFGGKGWF